MRKRFLSVLDFIVYWSIVVIPFSIAIAPAFTYSFMGLLFVAFIFKKIIRRERFFINNPVNLAYIFLILAAIFSFKNTVDLKSSVHGIAKLLENALLFLICAEEIKDKKHAAFIIFAAALGGFLAVFDGLWQIVFGKDFIRGNSLIINIGLKRATAAFPNANVFGVYLSAIAPLIIGTALYYFKGRKKAFTIIAGVFIALGIMLTFSRGTALALYTSVLFLSLMKKDKLIYISLIALLLISPFIMPKNIKDWARQVNYNPLIFMLNHDRISIYRNSLNMIKHHPYVGVGVGTFSENYLKYKLPEPENARTTDHMYAHNHFLQMAGEIGLLGLAAFLWFLYRLFKNCLLNFYSSKDEFSGTIALSLAACILAFLINGLTETSLYYSRVAMIFWFFVGFSLSLEKINNASKITQG